MDFVRQYVIFDEQVDVILAVSLVTLLLAFFFFSDVINVLYIDLCQLHKLCYSQNCC